MHRQASSTAGDLVTSAEQDAGSARSELDDYVDRTLANFEVVLPRTLAEVSAGRRQMVRTGPEHDSTAAARRALGELGGSAAPPTG